MKIQWICGCGMTHFLKPEESAGYKCPYGCGWEYPQTAPSAPDSSVTPEPTIQKIAEQIDTLQSETKTIESAPGGAGGS